MLQGSKGSHQPVKLENFLGEGFEETRGIFLGDVICPPGEIFVWIIAFFFGVFAVLEERSVEQRGDYPLFCVLNNIYI